MSRIEEAKERIKLYTEAFRLLWISGLTVGSGTVGLLLGEVTVKRWLFALAGAGLTIVCGETLRRVYRSIQKEIQNLKEEQND